MRHNRRAYLSLLAIFGMALPALAFGTPASTPCEMRGSVLDRADLQWDTETLGMSRTATLQFPDVNAPLGVTWTTRVRIRTGAEVVEWTAEGPVGQSNESMNLSVDLTMPSQLGNLPRGVSIVNVFLTAEDVNTGVRIAELSLPPTYLEVGVTDGRLTTRLAAERPALPMIPGIIDNDRNEMVLVMAEPTVVHPNYSDDDREVN